jgi:hypothetical protein
MTRCNDVAYFAAGTSVCCHVLQRVKVRVALPAAKPQGFNSPGVTS